jgi:hypothetical protein
MRSMSSRRWITALAVAAAFVAGIGADQLGQREAHAQSGSTATLYVPSGGLVFRATDGTVLARLSRDGRGGTFELYDDRHEVSMRVPKLGELAPSPYGIERDGRGAGTAIPDDGF